jgi:hypothetical protein
MQRPICGRQIGRSTHAEITQRGVSSEDIHSMMHEKGFHTLFAKMLMVILRIDLLNFCRSYFSAHGKYYHWNGNDSDR